MSKTFYRIILLIATSLLACTASAQLVVNVSPPKLSGEKAVVTLQMKNNFSEKVESTRAACFLLDEQGKMVGQATKWIIGGSPEKPGLEAGATNVFHFVVPVSKPPVSTNLTAKISVSRLVLAGGKVGDPEKDVRISSSGR